MTRGKWLPQILSKFRLYSSAIVTWVVLFGGSAVFYAVVVPGVVKEFRRIGVIFTAVDMLLLLSAASHFFMAIAMDPGVLPRATESEEQQHNPVRAPWYKDLSVRRIRVRSKWCQTCHFYRPPRSSHCSVCDHCIDVFDHHCPFLNNCIGRRNYRVFFTLLVLTSLHIILNFSLCLAYTTKTRRNLMSIRNIGSLLVMAICATFCAPIMGLLGYHVTIVLRRRTTYEQMRGKFRRGYNPFTEGACTNLIAVCCGPQMPTLLGREKKTASKRAQIKAVKTSTKLPDDDRLV